VVELEPILDDMDLAAQNPVIARNKVKRATKMVLGPNNKPLSKWGLEDGDDEDGDASGNKKRCVCVCVCFWVLVLLLVPLLCSLILTNINKLQALSLALTLSLRISPSHPRMGIRGNPGCYVGHIAAGNCGTPPYSLAHK